MAGRSPSTGEEISEEKVAMTLLMKPKRKRLRRKRLRHDPSEAAYTCDSCGEEVVVPVDVSQGAEQEYVEDCPVCCCPNVIHVEIDDRQEVRVWAERE